MNKIHQSVPVIEYEIYDPKTFKILNLTYCKDTKIKISFPVEIKEEELFKYNLSSEYYNDICNTYTTEKGTDISLSDRRNEFINNNMSLCESNCDFVGNNYKLKEASCECEVKEKIPTISEIIVFDKKKLLNKFINVKLI